MAAASLLEGNQIARRFARAAAACTLLPLLATLTPARQTAPGAFVHQAEIHFDPVPLDRSVPGRRRAGALLFLGGWSLHSDNRRFGGISAMHVERGMVTALNDCGWVIRFPVPTDDRPVLGRIDMLEDGPGSPLDKKDRDTEALAIAGGQAWVAYERRDAVWRYRISDWRSDAHAIRTEMKRWPNNGGSEGIVRLADGRFLVFSEDGRRSDGASEVLLFGGDPTTQGTGSVRLGYRAPKGYYVTDAAALPDGRLLILNRRASLWSGFSAKLVIARVPTKGALLATEDVATLAAPIAVDNMEALSVTREHGRTIVWIASDDNFSPPIQRTLLLKFALSNPLAVK